MTKSEARHVAAILNAWADGETIQYRSGIFDPQEGWDRWHDVPYMTRTLFEKLILHPDEFRIKPKPREGWTAEADIYPSEEIARGEYGWDATLVRVREVTDDE